MALCVARERIKDDTAMKGEDTLSCVAVSVQGKAKEIEPDRLPDLFRKNPYMENIYPDVRSRSALTVFKIYEGTGEWFDLSKLPIERASFTFGGAQAKETGYFVTDKCIGCKLCYYHIGEGKLRMLIDEHPNEDFYVMNGNRALIKREKFERYLDQATAV